MRLCYNCSSDGGTSTRGLSPSAVNGRDDQQQKEMKRVSKSREKERERENARVILVLRMFQVR